LSKKNWFFYGLIALMVLATDQITKYLIMTRLSVGGTVDVFPHFFRIVSVRNKGIVFGLFSQGSVQNSQWIFIGFTVAAMAAIIVYSERKKISGSLEFYPLALILGGAAGNLVDRILRGRVIDFLDFSIRDRHWPAFNVADSGIVIGVTILLIQQWIEEKNQKRASVGQ